MAAEENASMHDGATFDSLKKRLEEIVSEVESDGISLDDALKLYEEAVNIGIAACDASELDIPQEQEQAASLADDAVQGEGSVQDGAPHDDGAASGDVVAYGDASSQDQPADAGAPISL